MRKKLITILPVLFFALCAVAVGQSAGQQAEDLYREGKYQEAADEYNRVLTTGKESAGLYYNLGNCYYKLGENTEAILNYERALLLDPSDSEAKYNLGVARKAVVDKIDALPEFFVVRWYKSFVSGFSADQWGYISVGLFIMVLLMTALFFYSSVLWIKKTGFVVGICMLFLTLASGVFAVKQNDRVKNRDYAIVMTPSVKVKGAPDSSGTDLFVIHEGLKVRVIGMLGEWYNIRLADGNEGWLAKSDLEKI